MREADDFLGAFPGARKLSDKTRQVRAMKPVRKIVIKGAVDLMFKRSHEPRMVVVAPSLLEVQEVKTVFKDDKLVVDGRGQSIQIGTVSGSVSIVSVSGRIVINGREIGQASMGNAVVYIGLPELDAIKIKGSGDVTLHGLQQAGLEIVIAGSGDVRANGAVDQLGVSIVGSGDVYARDLIAMRSTLSVTGSGDITAHVIGEVHATVNGSGDIVVRGNPGKRSKQVHGSGEISFK